MADQRNLFEYLMDQIGLDIKEFDENFQLAQINHVDVFTDSRQWHFYVDLPQRISIEAYQIFLFRMKQSFDDIAEISVHWHFADNQVTDEDIQMAFQAVSSILVKDSPYLRSNLDKAKLSYGHRVFHLGLADSQAIEIFQSRYHQAFLNELANFAIEDVDILYELDEDLQHQVLEDYQERQIQAREALQAEAQEIQVKLQEQKQSAPVVDAEIDPIGKDIPAGPLCPMIDLEDNQFKQIIEGYVFSSEIRELRSGSQLLLLNVTDYTSSVQVKLMSGRRIRPAQLQQYKQGDWLRLEGDMVPDNYTNELYFRPRSLRHISHSERQDLAKDGEKRVELHSHTQMSQLDATNSASDLIKQAAKWGHSAIAITDHATVQAFPEAYNVGREQGIKVIFGMEAYVVNDGEPVVYQPEDRNLKEATYVVFDLETTGLSAVYASIIEIGAVKMHQGQVIDRFESFMDPGHPLSAFTTELTGISDADVQGAPDVETVLKQFWEFCQGSILVAHNASFDMGFINHVYKQMGKGPIPCPTIDTLELSRLVNPDLRAHGLKVLTKRYQINLEQHHRAVYDSEATGFLLFKLLAQAEEQFQMTSLIQLNEDMGNKEAFKNAKPFHVSILVKEQAGLKDLFKLVSVSNVKCFYRTPRIPRQLLEKYRQGLLIGSACAEGELFTTMMQKGYEEAEKLVDFYDYIEILPPSAYQHLIDEGLVQSAAALQEIIQDLIRLGQQHQIPVVATGNVHYLEKKDAIYREVIKSSLKVNAHRQLNLPDLHFRTTDEMLAEFAFLGQEEAYDLVVRQSQAIAESIAEIEVIKADLYPPKIEGAEEEIKKMSYQRAKELYGDPLPEIVEKRLEKELNSIIGNGFAVIYLISQKLVHKSNHDGYLVGSRGSVGSSLVATMTGITEVNPLAPHYYCPDCHYSEFFTEGEYGSGYDLPDKMCPHCQKALKREGQDIPFETFLGFNGDKVPDIDLNFSGDYQSRAHAYTKDLFGEDYVYRAGTIGTVAQKTALGYVRGYLEHQDKSLPSAERERLAYGIAGVKRTTGQHPGGIIVIPDYMDVFDFTPIQYPADDQNAEWRTTHFDFHSIDNNVLKLDILGHDDPTMIRMLQDLSGINPIDIPPVDEKVMQLFQGTEVMGVSPDQIYSDTGTLGIPEFGTNFVRGMVSETKPKTFAELLKISGLSHGTDVWLGNAQELIRQKIVPFADVIGCRDDIMVSLIQYGLPEKLSFDIMERVRKGRGIPEDWQETMREYQVPEWYIESCLKIKYMFPKAHAAAYVLMALRVAYFKVYHPIYYYAAYFSVRAKEFDILAMYQGKEMVKRRIRDIREKGFGATNKETLLLTELEIANEMLERGLSFKMVDLNKSDARNFVIEGDALIPPFRAIPGLGTSVADQIVQARQQAPFISKEDLQKRGKVSKSLIEYLDDNGVLQGLPDEDQLSLF
ncbi:PolC-type DNA polymerase III [Ignavigranum ruoffiae]|uniref:PolC-type DNA polymerase III n=1 Tax=Ignavigranum ruoffiae TaxID=89093 RepID=UPI00206F2D8A|nr:PolC-type DNA polymerase III [Ignavigranum ruoffiae]UPQ85464.1 PolC-type DNA polymerase III [Ignavigranum ruoffiae]